MNNTEEIFNTKKDVCNYVAMLKKMAMADGYADASENTYIADTVKAYAVVFDFESPEELSKQAELIQESELELWLDNLSGKAKRNLVKDLIALAICNKEYADKELDMVKKISARLGVSEKIVQQMTGTLELLVTATEKLQNIVDNGEV